MIISSPFVIILSADEHHELTCRARGARAAHRDVVRATIILAAAEGVVEHRDRCRSRRARRHRPEVAPTVLPATGWPV